MEVNFNKPLVGSDEKPIIENGAKVMLNDVVVKVLENNYSGDDQVGFMKKLERAKLARKIVRGKGIVDLRSEEINLIKDLAGRSASVPAIHCFEDLLDPEPPAKTAKTK